jgi:hypothetical protein
MRHLNHLPIWRDANRLLLAVEQAGGFTTKDTKNTKGNEWAWIAAGTSAALRRCDIQTSDFVFFVSFVVESESSASRHHWMQVLIGGVCGIR